MAEMTAARRAKSRRTVVRVVVAAVVILAALFAYSALTGDDGDDADTATDDSTTTTAAESTTSETTPTTFSNPELAQEVLAREAPDPEPPPEDTPRDALETETLIEGSGDAAVAAGDSVTVHYIGKIPDGTVFDQSWEREGQPGEPVPFTIGQGQVIPGWDQGLIGAKIGERRRLVIGSDNAYGEEGAGEDIPPNSPLAFEVDIVDITQGAPAGGSGG